MPIAPVITSRENALIKQLHKLAHDGHAYRKLGQIWLEGEHLVSSFLLKKQAAEEGLNPKEAYAKLSNPLKRKVASS